MAALVLLHCGGGDRHVESPTVTAQPAPSGPQSFPEDAGAWGRFHSKRFSLSVPLPDGKSWKIDDHKTRMLVATHPATHSTVEVYASIEPDLMNRQKCEDRARTIGLVSLAPGEELRTVDDEVTIGPDAYDTRVWVALRAGTNDKAPLTGHVFAFGAYVHKCLFFHFTSEVPTGADDAVLSERLAAARTRIFGKIQLDDFDSVQREKSGQ